MRLEITGRKHSRRGSVIVLTALLLIGLIGVVALAVDGGLLLDNRRRVQAAADAAAMAAAGQLFYNYAAISTRPPALYDPGSHAVTAARAIAKDNGFVNDGKTSKVDVHIPPKTGPFTGQRGYAEVIVTYFQPRYFSSIWNKHALAVSARSVALGRWGGSGTGVLVLDPRQQYALDASGGGAVAVTGGASMIVNSDHNAAARATGGGQLTAPRFRITGNYIGALNGLAETGVAPTPDPLRYLPQPAAPPHGVMTTKNKGKNKRYFLTPGRYGNLPNFTSGDDVVFAQASANSAGGIYYIDGGGIVSTGANMMLDPDTTGGIMIFNAPRSSANSNQISISGNSSGIVKLQPLTSGPYAGILFFQDRASTVPLSISGNGDFNLKGTFYAANAQLQITGNGNATVGSQYISRTLSLSGNGSILIDYSDDYTGRQRDVRLME
jgi:hypothetical protein